MSLGGQSITMATQWGELVRGWGSGWVGGQETLSLTACLCLASVPGPALPRSLSHWEMSRVSHHH